MRVDLVGWSLAAALSAQLAGPLQAALAVEQPVTGAQVFEVKCVACHALGGNAINPTKTLRASALESNGYASREAIAELINNGKGQMPSYGPKSPPFARLSDEQIAAVVSYVQEQASAGWPSS